MKWIALLLFAGCGAAPIDDLPRCAPYDVAEAFDSCGDPSRLLCYTSARHVVAGCWIEYHATAFALTRAECVESCQ